MISKPCAIDVQALGTIASRVNMVVKTPGNSLPRPLNQQHVLRCFNLGFVSNPVDLFGAKSESENIIVKVKGLSVSEMDDLLRIVIHSLRTGSMRGRKKFGHRKRDCVSEASGTRGACKDKTGPHGLLMWFFWLRRIIKSLQITSMSFTDLPLLRDMIGGFLKIVFSRG